MLISKLLTLNVNGYVSNVTKIVVLKMLVTETVIKLVAVVIGASKCFGGSC